MDRTPCRLENTENHIDRRGLSGSIRAEQSDDLAAFHVKGDPVYSHCVAVFLRQVLYRKHVQHCDNPPKMTIEQRTLKHFSEMFIVHCSMFNCHLNPKAS